MSTDLDTVVLGAGQAGLAAAAALSRAGEPVVVLERSAVGATWRGHYDRLHLNTDRRLSALPGLPIPAEAGQWVSRDDFVAYLERYADHFGLDVRTGVEVVRLDRVDGGWSLVGAGLTARRVVVATGGTRVPVLPDWTAEVRAPLVHSGAYRNPDAYAGATVLVVGAGNSGAEIAADLAAGPTREVLLSVRDLPALLPRSLGPVPTQLSAFGLAGVPSPVGDAAIALTLALLRRGDSRLGLGVPRHVLSEARAGGVPVVDAGLRDAVHAGRVRVVPAVVGTRDGDVLLADGTVLAPDAVVAATGWRSGLEPLVGHLGVLDDHGHPLVHAAATAPGAPDLHFVGLRTVLTGFMHAAGRDAVELAAAVAGEGAVAGSVRRLRRLLPLPA